MKLTTFFILISATIYSQPSQASSDPTIAIGVNAGTRGLGVDIIYPLSEKINLRGSYSGYNYNTSFDEDGIEYDGDLKLNTLGVLVDYHPFSGAFRISAGYFQNNNDMFAIAQAENGTVNINGFDYDVTGEQVTADLEWRSSAPYLGIGWGNPVSRHSKWTFSLELGVLFTGEPEVVLMASPGLFEAATQLGRDLNADIQAEQKALNEDISDFDVYPVLQLGLSYSF